MNFCDVEIDEFCYDEMFILREINLPILSDASNFAEPVRRCPYLSPD